MHLFLKRLVIIGNGFDVAHNLPTSYCDFLEQLNEKHHDFFEMICQYIPKESLWYSFEEALSELDEEQLQDDNLCYLLDYGDENWRDSAHHDFQYMIGEALSFAKDIPVYFFEWISKINTHVTPQMPSHLVDKNNLYLSFNYTDTLESVYNIPEKNILYIHGKASRGDELIVGHHTDDLVQDEEEPVFSSEEERQLYYDNYDEDVRVTEAKGIIKSYFKETYKDTETIIANNSSFFQSISAVNEIYIYGHSLSYIDFDYFIKIHNTITSKCKWNIYCYKAEDYDKAKQLVRTLNITEYALYQS